MASEVGLARLPHEKSAASRVNPTCSDKPGHDVERLCLQSSSPRMTVEKPGTRYATSCPALGSGLRPARAQALCRAPTSLQLCNVEGVDARDKRGHDGQ